ncbi:hypothetical protein AHAS_Ahas19G0289200 [Arachis hypogaea]
MGRVAKDGSDLGMLLAKQVEGNPGLEDAGRPGCSRVSSVAHDQLKATLGSGLLGEPGIFDNVVNERGEALLCGTGPRVGVSREVVAEARGTTRSASSAVDGDLEPGRLGMVRSVEAVRTQKQRDMAGVGGSNVGGGNWLVTRECLRGKDRESGAHPTAVEGAQGVVNGERTMETMAGSNAESGRQDGKGKDKLSQEEQLKENEETWALAVESGAVLYDAEEDIMGILQAQNEEIEAKRKLAKQK